MPPASLPPAARLCSPDPRERLRALHAPDVDAETLALLRGAGASADLQSIERTPALPPSMAERLVALGGFAHELLAANPSAPPAALHALLVPRGGLRRGLNLSLAPSQVAGQVTWEFSSKVLQQIASNPNAPAVSLQLLAGRWPERTLDNPAFSLAILSGQLRIEDIGPPGQSALAASPRAPGWLLMKLVSQPHHIAWPLFRRLAGNPASPPEVLDEVVRWSGASLRRALLCNPNVPPSHLERASRSSYGHQRALAAANPRTPGAALARLALDPDPPTRQAALANPSLPDEFRRLLERAGTWAPAVPPSGLDEREAQALLALTPHAARLLLTNPHLPPSLLERLAASLRREEGERLLAANPGLPQARLALLLTHERGATRAIALDNPSAPAAVVALLRRAGADARLQGGHPTGPLAPRDVARMLALGPFAALLLARHPCASPRLLAALRQRHGADPLVARALARHPAAGPALLRELGSHRAGRVRAMASERLRQGAGG